MEKAIQWLPWGQEAFQKAKQEQKPVFLHIGFPSCHWCHVMERESFEDPEVAALLNESFVCVDVDREQRPDVDAVYMAACQSMTGQGGWPLTALLTPSQKPFFITTYLPRETLLSVLREAKGQWARQRDRLSTLGSQISQAVQSQFTYTGQAVNVDKRLMQNGVRAFASSFDAEWGGIGIAPKFPMPHTLLFLLRQSVLGQDAKALSMAETTLLRMCEGGIFDHVGGGFMRYSTDRRWAVPHFEKMLIDNALLSAVYLEAWQITGRALYRLVADRTLQYVLREMTHAEGGFFSSQDADAEGEEGAYYHLGRKELLSLLGKDDGAAYARYYNLEEGGYPNRIGYEGAIETRRMAALSEKVRAYRAERMPLKRDEKILTAWNGQMIAALSRAYQATGEEGYLLAAVRAALFAKKHLIRPEGDLAIHWQNGRAMDDGLLDDYAWLSEGALSLYRATLEDRWLRLAVSLARQMLERFEDREQSGFFLTPHGGEKLVARPKETYDGAQPSGNAAALFVLVTLSMLDIGEGWAEAAERQRAFLSGLMADAPLQHMASLTAVMPLIYPVTLLDARALPQDNKRLLEKLRSRYLPLLFLKATEPGAGGSSWHVCQGHTCLKPFQEMEAALSSLPQQPNFPDFTS